MSFPRYPAYKPSGVEWLGEVPEHWLVEPFKRQIERNDGGSWGDDPEGLMDTIVLRSTEQTVDGRWKIEDPSFRKLNDHDKNSSLLVEGDLLLTKSSGSSLHIGKTTLVDKQIEILQCCFSNFMQRIRLKSTVLPRLGWYILNNRISRFQLDFLSNTTTGLANLNATIIGQIIIPNPPGHEQQAIISFLDHETAKIDALIAEQQRLIELLQEKRQAVISHAVTKGLNPDAPMKDSGVEWLGEVPVHWVVCNFQRFVQIAEGQVDPRQNPYADMPLIAPNHIQAGTGQLLGLETAAEQGAESGKYICNEGDVIYSKIRPSLRKACIAPCACLTSADMYPLRAHGRLSNEFLFRFLLSEQFSALAIVESERVAMPKINRDSLKSVALAIPPKLEQEDICLSIRVHSRTFDALIAEGQEAIVLLSERRSALISAAVTGQIDVRGLVLEGEAA